jgi:hypothetical protein
MKVALPTENPKLYIVPGGPDVVFEIEEAKPLIPDAEYLALCVGCDVRQVFQTLKVFLRFRVCSGPHEGIELFRAYRVGGKILPGKGPGSGPRPRLKRSGDLYKMLCRVLNLPKNTRAHRVSHRELAGKVCRVQTRTVTHDSKQRPLADRYSIVSEVMYVEAG